MTSDARILGYNLIINFVPATCTFPRPSHLIMQLIPARLYPDVHILKGCDEEITQRSRHATHHQRFQFSPACYGEVTIDVRLKHPSLIRDLLKWAGYAAYGGKSHIVTRPELGTYLDH